MSFSPFLMGKFLEAVAHGLPYSAPETWVALIDETGSELSNVDYVRQRVDVPGGTDPKWSAALTSGSGGRVENSTPVSFGVASVDWGQVKGVAVFDASVGGNELMRELLPAPRTVFVGDPFRIPAQALKIRLVANA